MSRRDRGSDGVHFEHVKDTPCRDADLHRRCKGRWRGVISAGRDSRGKQIRPKVSGRTKTEAIDNLRELRKELDGGVRTPETYTVKQCITDWLASLADLSPKTVSDYTGQAQHMITELGAEKLKKLRPRDVQDALDRLAGQMSKRSVQLARAALVRAIDHAQFEELATRNVAALSKVPSRQKCQQGRPSKSFTLPQVVALLDAAPRYRLNAYVVVSLLAGLRPEEARDLHWADVDLDKGVVYVVRSDRFGGDTKTPGSRRGLKLARLAVEALKVHKLLQAAERVQAGSAWQEHDLVFASLTGTTLDPSHVRRSFKLITKAAGLGTDWTPREMRHTFVSVLSDDGMVLRDIADLVGHADTRTTETVYRHQLKPVITKGAVAMETILQTAREAQKKPA